MSTSQTPTILIAYPSGFANYAKFERKVSGILSNLSEFYLAFCADDSHFISKHFCSDSRLLESPNRVSETEISGVTHAIIFNDGRSLNSVLERVKVLGIKLREIKADVTAVVNIDKGEKCDVYIGRGSKWGNPYAIGFDGDRDEVIRRFKYDFERGFLKFSKSDLLELRGKVLGCHCKPAACHGDVLAQYLNALDD